jgi:hypothetical protein
MHATVAAGCWHALTPCCPARRWKQETTQRGSNARMLAEGKGRAGQPKGIRAGGIDSIEAASSPIGAPPPPSGANAPPPPPPGAPPPSALIQTLGAVSAPARRAATCGPARTLGHMPASQQQRMPCTDRRQN